MFVESASRALGQNMSYRLESSVNPLVYKLKLTWPEPVSGELITGIWNVLQGWVSKNEAVAEGGVRTTPNSMSAAIVIRRRFGVPKKAAIWE